MGVLKFPPVKEAHLPESAQIWDVVRKEFVTAYRSDFKRQRVISLIDSIALDAAPTSKTGSGFSVAPFKSALILIDVAITGAPTDVLFSIEFSPNKILWYKYMIGPFGDLRYEDAAGTKAEALDIPILAPFMRAKAVATGTDGSKIFTVAVTAILSG